MQSQSPSPTVHCMYFAYCPLSAVSSQLFWSSNANCQLNLSRTRSFLPSRQSVSFTGPRRSSQVFAGLRGLYYLPNPFSILFGSVCRFEVAPPPFLAFLASGTLPPACPLSSKLSSSFLSSCPDLVSSPSSSPSFQSQTANSVPSVPTPPSHATTTTRHSSQRLDLKSRLRRTTGRSVCDPRPKALALQLHTWPALELQRASILCDRNSSTSPTPRHGHRRRHHHQESRLCVPFCPL